MSYPDLPLPTPPAYPSTESPLFDHVAADYAAQIETPGITEPSPWGPPLRRADPPPEPERTAIAPEVTAPQPRTVRRKPAKTTVVAPANPEVDTPVEKKRFTLPTFSGIKKPNVKLKVPTQANALFTPLACAIAGWSVAANLIGDSTQGLIAISVMSLLTLALLWFLLDVIGKSIRVKLGAFGVVLLLFAIAFHLIITIAPYSLLALISYWLYYPSLRGNLRRAATWFTASAIAWSITIFL